MTHFHACGRRECDRLSKLERWALAIGAPVIAAGILAVAGTLWGLYKSQIQMSQQLQALVENAYTVPEAQRDIGEVEHRIDNLEGRTRRLERYVLPNRNTGKGSS